MYRIYVFEKEVKLLVGFADGKLSVGLIISNLLSLGHSKVLVERREDE